MELKEFVTHSLTDIIGGVIDAQKLTKDTGAIVNPIIKYSSKMPIREYVDDVQGEDVRRSVQSFEFDVAITQTGVDETKGGLGVFLGEIGIGVHGKTSGESSELTRIKFSVPVVFPYQE